MPEHAMCETEIDMDIEDVPTEEELMRALM